MRCTLKLLAVVIGLAVSSTAANAELINFTHAWNGTEAQGPNRPANDGVPSVPGPPKPFFGITANNPTYFVTQSLDVLPGSVVSVTTTQDMFSFMSIYDNSFNHLSLATNFLGDAGFAGLLTTFSVTAPASGRVVVVGSSRFGNDALQHTFSANIVYTTPVPAPPTVMLAGIGLAGVAVRRFVRRGPKPELAV